MKKFYLKALCLGGLLLYALQLSSQTIDYQNSSLSTGCVFTTATDVDGISHQTSIGKVSFDASTTYDALMIVNQRTSNGTTYNSGQFRISYNFKQGYTYVIKATVFATKTNLTDADPYIRINLSNTSTSNSNCTWADVGGALSGNLIQSAAVTSSTPSEKIFNYTALSSNFSFLLVDAVPLTPSALYGVFIRKIVIEEGPPPVSFTVTTSVQNVECGTSTAKTFTINNVHNTPNVTNYTWNLGSASNGWIYNGSPAPQTINTGTTNTITLTPSCGAATLSNVGASVTAGGNSYNATAYTPTIVQPPMTLDGNAMLCTGSTNYTIGGLPCNATVSWSVSGASGIATLSTNGNTATLTKTGNGPITISASITSCGVALAAKNKSIVVGLPGEAFGITILDPNVDGQYMCPNTQYYAEAAFMGALYDQYFWVLPVDWYSPDWGSGNSYFYTTGQYPLVRIRTASYPSSGYITVYGVNDCGIGEPFGLAVSTENCAEFFRFRLSPNPVSSMLTIEATDDNPQKFKEDISEVRLYDAQGTLKTQQKYAKGIKKAQINVSAFREGVYFIEIGSGLKKTRKRILIKR